MMFVWRIIIMIGYHIFFFFQAEDGIRDADVTGVQTCALPIWAGRPGRSGAAVRRGLQPARPGPLPPGTVRALGGGLRDGPAVEPAPLRRPGRPGTVLPAAAQVRSEERRGGKEARREATRQE